MDDREEKNTQETTQDAQEAFTGDPGLYIQSKGGYKAFINLDGSINWDAMAPDDVDYYKRLPEGTLNELSQRLIESFKSTSEEILFALDIIAGLDNNPQWQQLREVFPEVDEIVNTLLEKQGGVYAAYYWWIVFYPMMAHVDSLKAYLKKIRYNGDFSAFTAATCADPNNPNSTLFTVWLRKCGYNDVADTLEQAQAVYADNDAAEQTASPIEEARNPAPFQFPFNITRLGTPQYYISASNNVTNSLPQLVNKGPKAINVGNLGRNNPLKINVEVSAPVDKNRVQIYGDYTEFDRSVHDSLCTIYCAGYDAFTLPELTRLVAANFKLNPSKNLMDEVKVSLNKMQIMDIYCDMTGIMSAPGYDLKVPHIKEKMIALGEADGILNGQPVTFIYFKYEPLLLMISDVLNQTQSTPIGMREIRKIGADGKPGKVMLTNKTRIAIRDYLWREIQAIKDDTKRAAEAYRKYENRRRHSKELPKKPLDDFRHMKTVILYETVFSVCGLTGQSRQTRINNVLYIKDCLNFWVNQEVIQSYREAPGNRKDAPRGVQIVP